MFWWKFFYRLSCISTRFNTDVLFEFTISYEKQLLDTFDYSLHKLTEAQKCQDGNKNIFRDSPKAL